MYGVTFKGIHCDTFDLVMKTDNRQPLPDYTTYQQSVPGLAGVVDFGMDTAGVNTLSVIFQYNFKGDPALLRQAMEQIGGWLYNDGSYYDLIFDDQPDRKYKAKVVKAVPLDQSGGYGKLSVEFFCNPPWPYDLNNNPVSPADVQARLLWDTATLDGLQYFQEFAAPGAMKFTLKGVIPVKPVIKLLGYIPAGLTLTYGVQKWTYTKEMQYDGIVIDCAAETVTRLSDGSTLFSNVDTTNDAYFTISPGQNKIDIAGNVGEWPNSLTILLNLAPAEAG